MLQHFYLPFPLLCRIGFTRFQKRLSAINRIKKYCSGSQFMLDNYIGKRYYTITLTVISYSVIFMAGVD